jgi:predicted esterase
MLMACSAMTSSEAEFETVYRQFTQAYQDQDWDKAVELAPRLDHLRPDSARVQYNIACAWAQKGDPVTALDWLEKAAQSGFTDTKAAEADADLETLHSLPGWPVVVGAIDDNRVRRQARISQVFATLPLPLALPYDWDGVTPSPLIITLHGYGGRADNFPQLWRRAASKKGAIVVAPWGHSPIYNGSSWTDLFEAETIVELTIEWVAERYPIDRRRIVLSGFSQGGRMSYAIAVRRPELFAGVIPMGSGYVASFNRPPQAGEHRPRYYFMVGDDDQSARQNRQAAADFEAAGYEVGLRVYPKSGHSFPTVDRNRELTRALSFVLP